MRIERTRKLARFAGLAALPLAMVLVGCAGPETVRNEASVAAPTAVAASASTAHDNLNAVLYIQTAAEYEAATRTVFGAALRALDDALADPGQQALADSGVVAQAGLPAAVIVDADETMIDNSAYQAERIALGKGFDAESWASWTAVRRAGAVAGALDFAAAVKARGVDLYFVTNRDYASFADTRANLEALGFDTGPNGERLLLRGDPRAPASDKGERRRFVARDHRVLLLLGDNFGDFVDGAARHADGSRLSPAERRAIVAGHGVHWGRDWFMLPNPMYGDFEGAVLAACLADTAPSDCKRSQLRQP